MLIDFMMSKLSALLTAFLLISCSVFQSNANNCHRSVRSILKDYEWNYSDSLNHYSSKKGVIYLTSGDNLQCLKTLNRSQIQKLFGEPSRINKVLKGFEYHLVPPSDKYSEYLYFGFDDDQRVVEVKLVMGMTSH